MSEVTPHGLLPAEHRALRELHATTRQLAGHWGKLARRLDDEPLLLDEGARPRASCSTELEERVGDLHDLHGQPAAQAVGARLAGARGVSDLLLERNQAFRTALLDLQHVTTLLAYLAALARTRGDERSPNGTSGWEDAAAARSRTAARAAAAAMGADPEAAIAPADESRVGRAGARSASRSGPSAKQSTIRLSVGWLAAAQPERVAVHERRRGRGGSRLHGHDLRRSRRSAAARRGALRRRSRALAGRWRDHRDRHGAARAARPRSPRRSARTPPAT